MTTSLLVWITRCQVLCQKNLTSCLFFGELSLGIDLPLVVFGFDLREERPADDLDAVLDPQVDGPAFALHQ